MRIAIKDSANIHHQNKSNQSKNDIKEAKHSAEISPEIKAKQKAIDDEAKKNPQRNWWAFKRQRSRAHTIW